MSAPDVGRVAVVHDWLDKYAGSERVLEQMLAVLPQADLFSVVDFVPPGERAFLGDRRPRTTFVQRLPFARTRHRAYLPLMPFAIEQLDLTGYDLVVSSSHAVAKGVLAPPDAVHLCYSHSPLRYAWDLQHEYLRGAGLHWGPVGLAVRWTLHRLRAWDAQSAARVDAFAANSQFVARRIRRAYRREATVIHPPVDVGAFESDAPTGARDYYVTASRLVAYKRVDVLVEAFRALPDRRLVVIGDGPEMRRLRRLASSNVELRGHLPQSELGATLRGARAFVFAGVEDFGIAPLEAQAAGLPVIAFAGGGAAETIADLGTSAPTGVLFAPQSPEGVRDGVRRFEANAHDIDAEACRANAERFNAARFRAAFRDWVEREYATARCIPAG